MESMLNAAVWLAAACCAATMGFAIQRGATCTVAAVDELMQGHGVRRLAALLEASLWVSGGLLVVHQVQALAQVPSGHPLTPLTVFGAVLLGLGAFVNRACVFGAIARFGSGEWTQAAAPLGFFLGCLVASAWFVPPPAAGGGSLLLAAPAGLAWGVAAGLLARAGLPLWRHRGNLKDLLARRLWSPHAATIVIGVTFLAMLLLVGAWAYTDVLAELAHGMGDNVALRALLFVCLLLGAVHGGRSAKRAPPPHKAGIALLRSLAGGMLMGCGSLLIPGGNDGLILIGMPMLWPHAWVAFATMCLSIAGAQWLQRSFAPRQAAASGPPA